MGNKSVKENINELSEKEFGAIEEIQQKRLDMLQESQNLKESQISNQIDEDSLQKSSRGYILSEKIEDGYVKSGIEREDHENKFNQNENDKKNEKMADSDTSNKLRDSFTNNYQKSHPVSVNFGEENRQINEYFEDIFGFTIYSESVLRNQNLKVISFGNNFEYFSIDNFEDIIQKLMEDESCDESVEKLTFLHHIYFKLSTTGPPPLVPMSRLIELKKITISYMISYLCNPEVFSPNIPLENPQVISDLTSPLNELLYSQLIEIGNDQFVQDFFTSFQDEELKMVMDLIFKRILRDCINSSIESTIKIERSIHLLINLFQTDKRIVKCFLNHQLFLPKENNGINLQKFTILGACLSINSFPLESKVIQLYFSEKSKIKNWTQNVEHVREKLHSIVELVQKVLETIIKSDNFNKTKVIEWLNNCLIINNAKQKTYNLGSPVCSDGWFSNFILLLFKFLQKPLEDFSKFPNLFDKIDQEYIHEKILFKDIQLLNGKSNIYFQNQESNQKFNFITELIFLTNHALFLQQDFIKKHMKFLQKLNGYGYQLQSEPGLQNQFSKKLCYDIYFADPYLLNHIIKLLCFDILYIVFLINDKGEGIQWEESTEIVSQIFRRLKKSKNIENNLLKLNIPAYWSEAYGEYILFVKSTEPKLLISNLFVNEVFMDFLLFGICEKQIIQNPHVRANYIRILNALIPQEDTHKYQDYSDISSFVFKNTFYRDFILENLICFFIDAESTGSNDEFYDKFNYRHSCCLVLNYVLKNFVEDQKFIEKQLDNITLIKRDFYLEFLMKYFNDIVYLLDESLSKLALIKQYQENQKSPEFFSISIAERVQRIQLNNQNQERFQIFMIFLKEYYEMIASLTQFSQDIFIEEEIREKFTKNLNYPLLRLIDENISELRTKNIIQLKVEPKILLYSLVKTFLNFKNNEKFLTSIVSDERSFSLEILQKAQQILEQYNFLEKKQLEQFRELMDNLKYHFGLKKTNDKFISEIKNIPEEYLDPLVYTPMKDPVMLPSSKAIVDRLTIIQHILSDPHDPFNRTPLNKEELVPQPELRKKIEEFFSIKREELLKSSLSFENNQCFSISDQIYQVILNEFMRISIPLYNCRGLLQTLLQKLINSCRKILFINKIYYKFLQTIA